MLSTKEITLKQPIFFFSIITFLSLFFTSCFTSPLTIKGRVFVENSAPSNDKETSDNIYHYVRGNSTITIRSGSAFTKTTTDGRFSLEGNSTEGHILLEVSSLEYQTAYMYVDIMSVENAGDDSDDAQTVYLQTVSPKNSIRTKNERSFSYSNQTAHATYEINHLNDSIDNNVIILLLRKPQNNTFNVFQYTEPVSN